MWQITLKLPSISPVKTEIRSDFMKTIDNAKRSAAMKSCILLHEKGALTDNLLPATDNEILQNLNYLFPHWREEKDYLPGTYKKKRSHKLVASIHIENHMSFMCNN